MLREGQGQAAGVGPDGCLDYVITNALVMCAVGGIYKADVGLKVRTAAAVASVHSELTPPSPTHPSPPHRPAASQL